VTRCWRLLSVALLAALASPSVDAATAATDTPHSGALWTLPLGDGATLPMAWIPPGHFRLGSPPSEPLRGADEGPEAAVTLSQGYWLGTTLVTIGQWRAVMGWGVREQLLRVLHDDHKYAFNGRRQTLRDYMQFAVDADPERYLANEDDELPMYFVSWFDAQAFCAALNTRERAAGRLPPHYVYALPTEAQWEYASRAGTRTASYAGIVAGASAPDPVLDGIAWYDANSGLGYHGHGWTVQGRLAGPHPVAQKRANAWGLYDMAGNLWEWCRDWYGGYTGGERIDPTGPPHGTLRVNRGGSFGSAARDQRSASRAGNPPAEASAFRGFRLALVRNSARLGSSASW